MSTSGLKYYSGRGEGNTSSGETVVDVNRAAGEGARATAAGTAALQNLIWFWESGLLLAGAEDVGDYVQVLVELHACAECLARFTTAAQQAGQLREAQVLELHDIAAWRRIECLGLGDWVLCPVQV